MRIPKEAVEWLGIKAGRVRFVDRIGGTELSADAEELAEGGVVIPQVPALGAMYLYFGTGTGL